MTNTGMTHDKTTLRPITDADWDGIMAIQAQCYGALGPESLEVMQSKWHSSPGSCFVMELQGELLGYCLAHPWQQDAPPPLYQTLPPLERRGKLYLHDMAFSAHARGKGLGKQALAKLTQQARAWQLDALALVAVLGADSYWQRQGFSAIPCPKPLDSYGPDALYMNRPL
ncbi:GNAT family N-acetyltransferase [Shewanella cyperi]|nr:GNAT family N-acetyltransferase [Shewanella cyperi]